MTLNMCGCIDKLCKTELLKVIKFQCPGVVLIQMKTRGSLAKKKDKLRKCFVSSLILLWQPKSAQSALSSMVFKI